MSTTEGNITRKLTDPGDTQEVKDLVREAARQGYLAGLAKAEKDFSLGAPQGHNEVFNPYPGLSALRRRIARVLTRKPNGVVGVPDDDSQWNQPGAGYLDGARD